MDGLGRSDDIMRDYFGFGGQPILIFFVLVIGTVAAVTCIYGAIFGFDTWSNNMQQAGSLMLSNFGAPATQPNLQTGPACPGIRPVAAQADVGQFGCPNCNRVVIPKWTKQGTPICPICGGTLNGGASSGAAGQLAAAP